MINGYIYPTNGFEKKLFFIFFLKIYVFYFFSLFIQTDFMYKYSHFTQNLRHIFKTVFPEQFSFSLKSSKISRNVRKLLVKLCNKTICPPWDPIKKIKSKTYSFLILNAKLVPKVTVERYWGKESRNWKIRSLTRHNFAKIE